MTNSMAAGLMLALFAVGYAWEYKREPTLVVLVWLLFAAMLIAPAFVLGQFGPIAIPVRIAH